MKLTPSKECAEGHNTKHKFKIYIKHCNPYITCLILYKTSSTLISNLLIQRRLPAEASDRGSGGDLLLTEEIQEAPPPPRGCVGNSCDPGPTWLM